MLRQCKCCEWNQAPVGITLAMTAPTSHRKITNKFKDQPRSASRLRSIALLSCQHRQVALPRGSRLKYACDCPRTPFPSVAIIHWDSSGIKSVISVISTAQFHWGTI